MKDEDGVSSLEGFAVDGKMRRMVFDSPHTNMHSK